MSSQANAIPREIGSRKYGAVAFLDILGFKGAWRNRPEETIANQIYVISKTIGFIGGKVLEDDIGNPNPAFKFNAVQLTVEIISDTIVITVQERDPLNAITVISQVVADIISVMMFPRLLAGIYTDDDFFKHYQIFFMRGAISYGWYYSFDRIYIGEAIDDAAEWYGQSNMIGAVLTPRTRYLLEYICDVNQLHHLVKHNVDTKIGKLELVCIDWPSFCSRQTRNLLDADFDLMLELFSLFSAQGLVGPDVIVKYKNTEDFARFCLNRRTIIEHFERLVNMEDSVLVVGGGIGGMTAAVEAAELGRKVYLVEKEEYLGGRVVRMNKYFPKLCPPYCGMEINFRRIRVNPNIEVFTLSEIESVTGEKGNFAVTIKTRPRYVNQRCVACDECVPVCPVMRKDGFNYGMSETKAIYLPHQMAMPMKYAIDMSVCKGEECGECVRACKYGAIDLAMKEETRTMKVGSVVYATGWKPYDASKIANLGYGEVKNVINNVEMERLAAQNGPTGGKILRRGDGEPVKTVAFVQCAGSRDENHLPYCSSICCLASLKQATYVRDQYPDSEVYIFYIDLRAPGKYEAFLNRVQADEKVKMVKGKVARIEEGADGRAVVTAEDILGGGKMRVACDLVVLATGMEPALKGGGVMETDENGFIVAERSGAGVFATGVAKRPTDVTTSVQDATGAALKAFQAGARRGAHV